MSGKKRYEIIAKCFDKKGRQLSFGMNDYRKSHPLMKHFAESVYLRDKIYLHAEVLSLLRAGEERVYKLSVERYTADGRMAMAKPCPVCQAAIKAYGVSEVSYTTNSGWVTEQI